MAKVDSPTPQLRGRPRTDPMDRHPDISSSDLPSSHLPDAVANESVMESCARVDGPAEDIVLEPLADFPHIDLRTPGEPWEKRRAAGKCLRAKVPHDGHGPAPVPEDRPDPVRLIEEAQEGRQDHLIPLRVARMASSPFAFLRGAATVMAWDLAQTPTSGIDVVMNGDAHISNFGLFGTPQRDIVLDLNDFDEVTIGPWEWDLKRLCASIEVAARDLDVPPAERREAVIAAAHGYQHTMTDLAPRAPSTSGTGPPRRRSSISAASPSTTNPATWCTGRSRRRASATTRACSASSASAGSMAAGASATSRRS